MEAKGEASITQHDWCAEHGFEVIKGFCKDCSSGICFRCAISNHRNHNMVNIDEMSKGDIEPMIITFENCYWLGFDLINNVSIFIKSLKAANNFLTL